MKKLNLLIVPILCLSFLFPVDKGFAQSSKRPQFLRVDPVAFQQLTKDAKVHQILIAQGDDEQKKVAEEAEKKKAEEEKKELEQKKLEKRKEESSHDSPRTRTANSGSDLGLHLGSDFGGSDAALIVFAVVGLVIVFAWIPYFPILFYDYLSHPDDYDTHQILSLNFTAAPHNRSHYKGRNQYRQGFLAGTRYSLFFKEKKDVEDDFELGLSTEIGHYQLENDSSSVKNFYGEYWLLGPSLMFGLPEFWLQLDLMGGSTFDSNLGLMTKADVSLNGKMAGDFFLGLGFGALYYDVKGGKGLATGDKDVGFTWLVKAGHSF